MAAAASNPRTWRSRSRLKFEPNWRSIRYAAINASPALHTAKATEPARVRSPNRLATIVAVAAPIATGHRAPGPSAIRAPVAIRRPGQKTATPSGFVSRKRPSRAPRKKLMPTATAMPIAVIHCRVGSATARHASTRLPVNRGLLGIQSHPIKARGVIFSQSAEIRWQCPLWVDFVAEADFCNKICQKQTSPIARGIYLFSVITPLRAAVEGAVMTSRHPSLRRLS